MLANNTRNVGRLIAISLFASITTGISSCEGDADGDGFTLEAGDCNDNDSSIHPGATEYCDGFDDDCDDKDTVKLDVGIAMNVTGSTLINWGEGDDGMWWIGATGGTNDRMFFFNSSEYGEEEGNYYFGQAASFFVTIQMAEGGFVYTDIRTSGGDELKSVNEYGSGFIDLDAVVDTQRVDSDYELIESNYVEEFALSMERTDDGNTTGSLQSTEVDLAVGPYEAGDLELLDIWFSAGSYQIAVQACAIK